MRESETTPRPELRFLTPAELRAVTPPEPDWLWDDYLAASTIVLLAGKPKAGKSTLAFALAEAITADAGSFLGRQVAQAAAVYVTEEPAVTVLSKLPPDSTDNFYVLTRDGAWPKPDWAQLVAAATGHALTVDARLIVIDTVAYWGALAAEREKDAGAVQAVMQPLVDATRHGLVVLLVHHQRKGGGEDGDAIRGSSAWAGSADTILELERPGEDAPPGHRLLATLSRFPQTPAAVVIDRDPSTEAWRVVGQPTSRRDAREAGLRTTILDALPEHGAGLTRSEIETATGLDWRKINGPLIALVRDGTMTRDGAGERGSPYRYRKLSQPSEGQQRDSTDSKGGAPVVSPLRGGGHQDSNAAAIKDTNGWHPDQAESEAARVAEKWGSQEKQP